MRAGGLSIIECAFDAAGRAVLAVHMFAVVLVFAAICLSPVIGAAVLISKFISICSP